MVVANSFLPLPFLQPRARAIRDQTRVWAIMTVTMGIAMSTGLGATITDTAMSTAAVKRHPPRQRGMGLMVGSSHWVARHRYGGAYCFRTLFTPMRSDHGHSHEHGGSHDHDHDHGHEHDDHDDHAAVPVAMLR